jgi:hypothetical protein
LDQEIIDAVTQAKQDNFEALRALFNQDKIPLEDYKQLVLDSHREYYRAKTALERAVEKGINRESQQFTHMQSMAVKTKSFNEFMCSYREKFGLAKSPPQGSDDPDACESTGLLPRSRSPRS